MFVRGIVIQGFNLVLLATCGVSVPAQAAPEPTAYTVTVTNSLLGPPQIAKIYRLGSKALIDSISAEKASDPNATHVRSLYDLESHRNLSWSWPDSSAGCGSGTFSGDWGDPFSGAADLIGSDARQVGTETIHGFPARIMEASVPGARVRAWIDTRYGMVLKALLSQQGSELKTITEVTELNLNPPPVTIFAIPASCAAAAAAPPPPTEAEQIAALTGSNPQDFVKAIYGPGSKNACAVLFRVVKAETMEPIASGFQVAVDLNVLTEPTPSYRVGISQAGHTTFSGGGLHEIFSSARNGIFRIDNAPAQFDLETGFGNAGDSQANVYLQCFAPQTVLLFVVKNSAKLSDGGELLWVKSGQYATISH